ncbi:MAG: DUF2189 domain-containing protein [Pseudomonadota bacterium]
MTAAERRPDPALPGIRKLTFGDLKAALRLGLSDFRAAPSFGLFFAGIYAIGGILLTAYVLQFRIYWLLYPLVIGFSLIGPFIAAGLYDVSRRREQGLRLDWPGVLGVVWHQRRRELGWMAFVMLFVFWIWMYQARTLFAVFFGFQGFATFEGFLTAVLTTTNGWTFLLAGHVVGALISLVLFALTVVSCPLLLDRDVDFVTAMITSIRAVCASPVVMIFWGLFVTTCVVISALPGFLGLLITLPVLGHATWHLYRRVVVHSHD